MKIRKGNLLLASALVFGGISLSSCGPHEHVFDQEVIANKYLARRATCTQAAKYYYSCKCGEKCAQTFTYGEPAGHEWELIIGGSYRTSYLAGESFDKTGMTGTLFCPNCDEEEDVTDDLEVPETALVASNETQTLAVSFEDYEAKVSYEVRDYVVSNVNLVKDDGEGKVFYVVSGKYSQSFDIDNFFFSLAHSSKLYWTNDKTSSKFSLTKNASEMTFEMKLDVTEIVADQVYYPYFYGKAHYDANGEDRISDFSAQFNGRTVTLGNMVYTIHSNTDVEEAPFCMPSLVKTMNLTGASYAATSVGIEKSDDKVLYVITGTSSGYSNGVELKSDIQIEFRDGNSNVVLIQDNAIGFTYDSATGGFTLKIDVTNLQSASIPYYVRLGEPNNGRIPDFKNVEQGNVDTTTVIDHNSNKYQIVFVKGSTSSGDGYGTVAIKVTADNSPKVNVNSVGLRKDDGNSKVYFTIGGVCANFASKENFKSSLGYQLRMSAYDIPKKEDDIVVKSFDDATGAYVLEIDVTDVAVNTKPYYMRFGMKSDGAQTADFKDVDPTNVDTTTVYTMAGKQFQVLFVKGGNSADVGWGCVSLKVSSAA